MAYKPDILDFLILLSVVCVLLFWGLGCDSRWSDDPIRDMEKYKGGEVEVIERWEIGIDVDIKK